MVVKMNEREIAKKVITEELEKDGYKVLKLSFLGVEQGGILREIVTGISM